MVYFNPVDMSIFSIVARNLRTFDDLISAGVTVLSVPEFHGAQRV